MELFFPIKVTKGDQLPQKVCNRCSCKVNDIYQFCNIAIEAQDRLRGMLLNISTNLNDSIDLTVTKRENLLPIIPGMSITDQGTQTEMTISKEEVDFESPKVEPKSRSPSPIKREECSFESEHHDLPDSILSDDSDDMSLIALKKRKTSRKPSMNGDAPVKRGRKKKGKLKELIMNALPDTNNVSLLDKPDDSIKTDVKEETDFLEALQIRKTTVKVKKTVVVKKELNETDSYQCCICLLQCYSRSATLQHYR
ncbi:hypothetical protein evm_002373 [Chilo suppressalis]|nr:hypothetical protein evm_002373 [Chilo suppressalis]